MEQSYEEISQHVGNLYLSLSGQIAKLNMQLSQAIAKNSLLEKELSKMMEKLNGKPS